jgi:hypothetical protein
MPSLSKLSSTFASADAQFIFTGGKRFCKKQIQVFFSVFFVEEREAFRVEAAFERGLACSTLAVSVLITGN